MNPDPEFDRVAFKRPPRRSNWFVWLLVYGAPVLLLIALSLPARRSSREAARRSQCVNNLKQIALALHNYEDRYGTLPPASTVDAAGRPLHSWRTLILPFLYPAEESMYRRIDLAKPWDDPANAEALRAMPPIFRCPSALETPNATPYLAAVGPDACFPPDRPRRLAEITHDHAGTLMIIEAHPDSGVPWMAPRDADAEGLPAIVAQGSHHPGGTNAALVDGSVRFLRKVAPTAEIREMGRITADESKRPGAVAGPSGG